MKLEAEKLRSINKKEKIELCQELLPNRMQCTQTQKYKLFDISTTPPTYIGTFCTMHTKLKIAELNQVRIDEVKQTDSIKTESEEVTQDGNNSNSTS